MNVSRKGVSRLAAVMCLLAGLCGVENAAAQSLVRTSAGRERARVAAAVAKERQWWYAVQKSVAAIQQHGAGGYSTTDAAHDALKDAFTWQDKYRRPGFNVAGARPSFCSGAVYAAVLGGLLHWESAQGRRIFPEKAWRAMLPERTPDGEGVWGWANANGPGFALLVRELGAGVNFTDWSKAQPSDILKIWWTDEIGGRERGHLVILVQDLGDKARVWSSHSERGGQPGGFGIRTIPKSAMSRVLFTRITNPAAFARAPKIGTSTWLQSLLSESVTWEDCLRRCGVPY